MLNLSPSKITSCPFRRSQSTTNLSTQSCLDKFFVQEDMHRIMPIVRFPFFSWCIVSSADFSNVFFLPLFVKHLVESLKSFKCLWRRRGHCSVLDTCAECLPFLSKSNFFVKPSPLRGVFQSLNNWDQIYFVSSNAFSCKMTLHFYDWKTSEAEVNLVSFCDVILKCDVIS